jgi:fucose 4-O-acetylase-like acetyltransferase
MKNFNPVLSHSITELRFPLAVLVVLGHANILSFPIKGITSPFEIIQYPILFLSKILFEPAVPLFFVISGILFFWSVDQFKQVDYRKKIRKRFYTLLIPYLVWNLIYDVPSIGKTILHFRGG